ncbi:MAG TPA: hypothetical protein VJH89_00310 [Patescibacteria group bacterium]|nr:hypothetical protein [Patescibacteria group bacterium]
MKRLFLCCGLLGWTFLSLVYAQSALYQMTDDTGEVVWVETLPDNPENENIQEALEGAGFVYSGASDKIVKDVWCIIIPDYETPILYMECYQPQGQQAGKAKNGSFKIYDPITEGYTVLPEYLYHLRETTRQFIQQ